MDEYYNNLTKERIMRKVLFLTTLLAFILTSSAWAADISGKWTLTMWGAGAQESVPLVIKAADENLTITCSHPTLKEMAGTGTLKGDAISFNLKSSSMEFNFSGKVTGNKMEGTRKVGSIGGGRGGAAGGAQGGQGGAPDGAQGGQGQAPGGQSAPAGAQGAPQGQAGQGGAQAQGNENWTAVKN
jgi:hypothetical protein